MLKRRRIKYKRKKLIVKIYKLYNSNNKIINIKHFKNCSNQSMIILLKVSPKYMILRNVKLSFIKNQKRKYLVTQMIEIFYFWINKVTKCKNEME